MMTETNFWPVKLSVMNFLLGYFGVHQVLTCCVLGDNVSRNRSSEVNKSSEGGLCNMTFNNYWMPSNCETNTQGSTCAIPEWFFLIMAAFQGILLLILGSCLLVARKYVTSQCKREVKPVFVPSIGQSNDYHQDDGIYLQPSMTNQKVPPCAPFSVTRTDQETYDKVSVRGGSANKRGKANIKPEGTSAEKETYDRITVRGESVKTSGKAKTYIDLDEDETDTTKEHYDFPSNVVRRV